MSGGKDSGSLFRTFFAYVWAIAGTILWGQLFLLFSLFPGGRRGMHRFLRIWSRWCSRGTGSTIKIEGRKNIPRGRPVVFAANHPAALDALVVGGWLPVDFRWMTGPKWDGIPVVGWFIHRLGYLPISPSDPQSLVEAADEIGAGNCALFFPEGKVTPVLGEFKLAGFWVAHKAGAPIIPVSVIGTREIFDERSYLVRKGRVKLIFSGAIDVKRYGENELERLRSDVRSAVAMNLPPIASPGGDGPRFSA
jgi:1-acyl-sn-glycerol-3-phosphate acyltransferase